MSNIKHKVDLKKYKYKDMYERFMKEPSPSVCVTGTFDITNVYKQKKKGHSLNALLCYCILHAAQNIEEFHYSIKEDGLYYYEKMKTNAVVNGKDGLLYYADYKYYDNFQDFEKEYKRVNKYCYDNCTNFQEDTGSLIGTSAIPGFPFTSISLDVSVSFWDNFIMWGSYETKGFKKKLNISLRFHHATIDGQRAALFFNELQQKLNTIKL
jgi:chloramphenicol O-acetyltransferase type A